MLFFKPKYVFYESDPKDVNTTGVTLRVKNDQVTTTSKLPVYVDSIEKELQDLAQETLAQDNMNKENVGFWGNASSSITQNADILSILKIVANSGYRNLTAEKKENLKEYIEKSPYPLPQFLKFCDYFEQAQAYHHFTDISIYQSASMAPD